MQRLDFPGIVMRSFFALLLSLALFQARATWATSFHVNPIQVFLSDKTPNALLTLRNESREVLHFQLSALVWEESPKGKMVLSPTEDIIFFPPQLVVAPGQERKVRLGRAVPVDSTEKTYRLFVELLPPLEVPGSQQGAHVRMLPKASIPIFLQPNKQVREGRVEEMAMRKGLFSFQIKNTGNIHFVPQDIRVRGFGSAGEAIFERQLPGWYILAGGLRVFELDLSKENCVRIKALAVEFKAAQMAVKEERLPVPPGACGQ